ncbi:MAG: hypothetical protein U9R08_04090 [Nanoarchaeota archaeon]|nr:hypothetical protein [Nanoarchaeota archaeon]
MPRLVRVFIVINKDFLDANPYVRNEIADLYTEIYNASPWNEDWTKESALNELLEVEQKQGFAGAVARDQELVAFSWGYKVQSENTARVDFRKIRAKLEMVGLDPEDAFYGADTGVRIDYRKNGIGSLILKERAKSTDAGVVLFRTLNPQMLRIYRTALGKEIFSFLEESSYKGGRVYVFKK